MKKYTEIIYYRKPALRLNNLLVYKDVILPDYITEDIIKVITRAKAKEITKTDLPKFLREHGINKNIQKLQTEYSIKFEVHKVYPGRAERPLRLEYKDCNPFCFDFPLIDNSIRYKLPEGTPSERLEKKWLSFVYSTLGKIGLYPSGKIRLYRGDFPELFVTDFSVTTYSGTWRQDKIGIQLTIPKKYQMKDVIIKDRIISFIDNTKTVNGFTVCKVHSLHRKLGYTFEIVEEFVAFDEKYAYPADSVEKAVKGLNRKIKINETKIAKVNNQDSLISIKTYRDITGACDTGCKNWCKQNNIDPKKRMKASELYPILEKTKAYGYDRFKLVFGL